MQNTKKCADECAHGTKLPIMKEIAGLLNRMCSAGVITDYAVFGAAAQMRYTEPVATVDADVLIEVPEPDKTDVLQPVFAFCTRNGYAISSDTVLAGAWPVHFIPVFSPLTREAVEQAETVDFDGVPIRVVRADYLAVIALSVGRVKDSLRIMALLEAGSVRADELRRLAERHGLSQSWERFAKRFLDE
jgi:hypothetical protein